MADPEIALPEGEASHYGGRSNPYEAIKVIRAWNLGFELGNALKYICRAGKKDPATHLEDLEKSSWYIAAEIERLKGATE